MCSSMRAYVKLSSGVAQTSTKSAMSCADGAGASSAAAFLDRASRWFLEGLSTNFCTSLLASSRLAAAAASSSALSMRKLRSKVLKLPAGRVFLKRSARPRAMSPNSLRMTQKPSVPGRGFSPRFFQKYLRMCT